MQNQNWRYFTTIIAVAAVTVLVASFSTFAAAQNDRTPELAAQPEAAPYQAPPAATFRQPGTVIKPYSSVERPEDLGIRAHTNVEIFVPAGRLMSSMSPDNTFAEYPASIACVYKVGPQYAGCVPGNGSGHASGGWGAIAVVDAYDDPNAASDLAYFDTYFGLPKANFTKVYANSSFGTLNGLNASCSGVPKNANLYGWDLEESLDIEWAHAMAPSAKIILVEACSNSYNDLFFAEEVAGIKVAAAGGGDISNSWGGKEWSTEYNNDNFLYRYYWSQITYFASAGDTPGVSYPSASPWVVSTGGTTINRDAGGNFLSESAWSSGGGGVSTVEAWQNPPIISNGMGPWTDYQYQMFGQANRATPDLSFDSDPASGVWVYDTDSGGGWYVVGGTSLASPALAGIVNASNNRFGQAPRGGGYYFTEEDDLLYSQLYAKTAYAPNFYDVTTGSCGTHNAGTGYDLCTGIGTPRGKLGK